MAAPAAVLDLLSTPVLYHQKHAIDLLGDTGITCPPFESYVGNLVPVTLGNIVGGAVFVGALYWLSVPNRRLVPAASAAPAEPTMVASEPELAA